MKSMIACLFLGMLFVALGLGLLLLFNYWRGWNLDFFLINVGFLQAWIYSLQTIAIVASVGYLAFQAVGVQKAVKTNTAQLMATSHRELFGRALDRPELHKVLTGTELPTDENLTLYLSMILNHGFNAHMLRTNGYIDDEWWKAILEDMKSVMRRGAMRKWWEKVKASYPPKYREFVEKEVLS